MNKTPLSSRVAVAARFNGYGEAAPYSPSSAYPEYPFGEETVASVANPAYEGVRKALELLDLDANHHDTKAWNPLGEVVQPGDTVVLKPNFVREFRETQPGHGDCLITHGSVIRAALDYVYIALRGQGRIIIADAPHNDAGFDAIRRIAGLDQIQDYYHQHARFDIEVYDLRPERAIKVNGIIAGHEQLPGDPKGYVSIDLRALSAFSDIDHLHHLLYGSEYDTSEVQSHHREGAHEYLICGTVLGADCVINLPKLKIHKRTGLTVCLKNLVGIAGNKNWLPHYRIGTPAQGGDQFDRSTLRRRIERRAVAAFKRLFPLLGPLRHLIAGPAKALGSRIFGDTNTDTIRSGSWYGNDTTWRMVIDLNRILMYADRNRRVGNGVIRRVLNIVDGVVAGEGNGPLDPTPKPAGVILAGTNPVTVDLTCARLMGFDYHLLPMLSRAMADHPLPLVDCSPVDILCLSNHSSYNRRLTEFQGPCLAFDPHFGWKSHIEIRGRSEPGTLA